jgi:hypothetical protein
MSLFSKQIYHIHKTQIEIHESANNDPFYNASFDPIYELSYNLNEKQQIIYYKWIHYFLNNYKKHNFNWKILPKEFLEIIKNRYKDYIYY